ncbi:MAG: phenylacetate--CoA ligase family protein, partial [Candidatus Zixiibacteriota bacterium]
ERAFRAPVYSWYGLAEKAALAGERLGDTRLHVLPSYGYVYLRGENGQVITEAETPGEIIATGFTNQATQFVNYHTGDIGLWSSAGTGRLGAFLTRILERVEGRAQELALSAGGRKISMCAINMHSDIFDRIRQFRFVQRRRGEILMQIIRKPGYGAEDENEIISGMTEKFGADMKLDIEYIDRLPRAQSGKARFLVQHLDLTEA